MKIKGGPLAGRPSGALKPRAWETYSDEGKWCSICRDYTEHDRLGCVECYDPNRDVIDEIDSQLEGHALVHEEDT